MFVWLLNGTHISDSGVRDLTKAHNFFEGIDTVKQDRALQGLVLYSSLIENWRD